MCVLSSSSPFPRFLRAGGWSSAELRSGIVTLRVRRGRAAEKPEKRQQYDNIWGFMELDLEVHVEQYPIESRHALRVLMARMVSTGFAMADIAGFFRLTLDQARRVRQGEYSAGVQGRFYALHLCRLLERANAVFHRSLDLVDEEI